MNIDDRIIAAQNNLIRKLVKMAEELLADDPKPKTRDPEWRASMRNAMADTKAAIDKYEASRKKEDPK
jgi:hypothetical protein